MSSEALIKAEGRSSSEALHKRSAQIAACHGVAAGEEGSNLWL